MSVPVEIKLVKGTPKVKIHYFVRDRNGPIHTEKAMTLAPGMPPVVLGGVSGYVACDPQRKTLNGHVANGRVQLLPTTGEVPATTCPECMATAAFKKAAEELAAKLTEHLVERA